MDYDRWLVRDALVVWLFLEMYILKIFEKTLSFSQNNKAFWALCVWYMACENGRQREKKKKRESYIIYTILFFSMGNKIPNVQRYRLHFL